MTARLYNSNPIKEVVKEVSAALRLAAGIRLDEDGSRNPKREAHVERERPSAQSGRNKTSAEASSPEANTQDDNEDKDDERGDEYAHLFASASEDDSVDVERLRAVVKDDALDEHSMSSSTDSRHDTIAQSSTSTQKLSLIHISEPTRPY